MHHPKKRHHSKQTDNIEKWKILTEKNIGRMVETGYRYQELYWAGQDQNWEYADYQIEKIKIAIENGLERRPKRAKSAEHLLTYILPEMKKALIVKTPQFLIKVLKL